MLQNIDKAIRGWITKAIVALITLSFTLWGAQVWLDRDGQATAVKVGKYNISIQELENRIHILTAELAGSDFGRKVSLRKMAFEELVQEKFWQNLLDQTRSWLTTKELPLLKSLPSKSAAKPLFDTLNELPDGPRKAKLASIIHISQMISESGFSLPSETSRLKRNLNQLRSFELITLQADDLAKAEQVNKEKIASYYKEHREELLLPAEVKLKKLVLNHQFLREQIANDKNLQAEYEQELVRIQAGYTDEESAKHFTEIVAKAEASVIRHQADKIVRELKYNAARSKEIADSYGLSWQDLPILKESDLPAKRTSSSFDLHLFFRSRNSGGWVITAPLNWSAKLPLVTSKELAGGGAVILWPAEARIEESASLEQATPIIKERLAKEQAMAKMQPLTEKLAKQWRASGNPPEALLKKFNLQVKKVEQTNFSESYKPEVELAFQKCSLVSSEERVASHCANNQCWIVRLDKISDSKKAPSKSDEEIAKSSWRDLERQALSVNSDKKLGIRLKVKEKRYLDLVE